MPGTPMPFVKPQFFDAGIPAAGYQLFTYDAGGVIKANTYTDQALTTPNANPIVLDSAGRAVIYLQSKLYKFVLATDTAADPPAGGDQVWTMDNIASVPFYNISTTINTVGTAPNWTASDNELTLLAPPAPVTLSNYYVNNATGTTTVDVPAGTLANNGDQIICEWEVDYASATLSARGALFGTNVDLGTAAASTMTRARYVINRSINTDIEVSQTVLQNTGGGNAQVAAAHTNIGSLDLDNNDYNIVLGMASGTWTIRGARIWYTKATTDLLG